jgi:regulator of cell morphogenesis and NO signaling
MKNYRTDVNNHLVFSKDMKVAELIDADYVLLSVLLRFDMQLPFGDISIEEMCERYNVSAELFLMLCQVYCDADYSPDIEQLIVADLRSLLVYLRASHRLYLDELLPSIGEGVEQVLECCSSREKAIVRKFYEDYLGEVRAHLEYEENSMFPYIEKLIQSVVCSAEGIGDAMEQHVDICEKIDDVKSILIKYLPETCTTKQRYELLCDVFRMREDLVRHTLVEIKILAPLAVAVERRLRNEAI